MVHVFDDINMCHTPYCDSSEHEEKIEDARSKFVQVIEICGKEIFGSSRSKQDVIPV